MKRSETATGHKHNRLKLNNSQLGIEILLLGLACFMIYLFLALFSFNPRDPSWSQTAMNGPIHNWGGATGAYFADILLQLFGCVAYLTPFALLALCIQLVYYFYYNYGQPVNYFTASLRLIGLLAFLFSSTGFFALNINDWTHYQSGGILGALIAVEIYPVLGQIGASLLFLSLGMISITLLTGYSWLFFSEKLGAFIVFTTWPLLSLFSSYLAAKKEKQKTKAQFSLFSIVVRKIVRYLPFNLNRLSEEKNNGLGMIIEPNQRETNPPRFNDAFMQRNTTNEPGVVWNHARSDHDPNSVEQRDDIYINPDYYSPINQKVNADSLNEARNVSCSIAPIGSYLPNQPGTIDNKKSAIKSNTQDLPGLTSSISQTNEALLLKPQIDHVTIHNSLIHPFLLKNDPTVVSTQTPMPCYDLLSTPPVQRSEIDFGQLESMARRIEKSLADFRVKARVVDYKPGPVVTLFEIELAPGIKASRIATLDRDLARSLSMPSVRVVEVIPGKPYVGLELPNQDRETVYFREVLDSAPFHDATSPLTIVLGKDIGGVPVVADIAKTPHLLVAGTTGSGKSVGVNAMILSILYKATPDEVRFIMIDPKMLELSVYEGIPHLLTDVVTDMKDASNALNWCVNEMERRYRLMSVLGVRNVAGYNEKINLANEMGRPIPDPLWKANDNPGVDIPVLEKLPYIVVLIDEFADLIMAVGKKIEELIARLAQKARAAGIHLVLATQRPSVDVITGLIKANIPTRIAFTVSSKIDSRTILDQSGAESLLGMGDMLYLAPNSSIPIRVHGAFVRDDEVHAVVQDWKARAKPKYIENITTGTDNEGDAFDNFDEELDPLFDRVVEFVVDKRRASISGVQRQFRIGYNRAARIVEQMEMQGIVSAPSHNGNREVIAPPAQSDF